MEEGGGAAKGGSLSSGQLPMVWKSFSILTRLAYTGLRISFALSPGQQGPCFPMVLLPRLF